MITRNLGGVCLVLAIILIVCVMWSHASAMSAVTEMVVIENSGTTVKVMDTDGNVYLFRFRDGSSFVANTRVKVELDITFDRKNPEHFLLNDMFILKVVVDRKGGE